MISHLYIHATNRLCSLLMRIEYDTLYASAQPKLFGTPPASV
jgi:hypothetical protein